MDSVECIGLAKVQCGLSNKDTASLVLTDVEGSCSGFLIGPEGLEALLEALLPLLQTWASHPEFDNKKVGGDRQAIAATAFSLQKGRNNAEAAVRLNFGACDLVFLVSLDDVVNAMSWLASQIDPDSGKLPH